MIHHLHETLKFNQMHHYLCASFRYSLVEGAAGVFMVEEWTGIIRTVARLDRERVAQYMLVLQAQDSSLTEARSATTQVRHSNYPLPGCRDD